jgi:hypothetical protein
LFWEKETKKEWYDVNYGTMKEAYDAAEGKDSSGNKTKTPEVNADVKYYFDLNALTMAINTSLIGYKGNERTQAEVYRNFQKSVLGQSTSALAYLYTSPPGSTTEYLADVLEHTGLIPKTYAQGVTYSRLMPLLPIWKTFRNIAYILLTLVMLLIGVMIMFRQKINANAVASIENTIPNVVVTLIIITFSYPIATLILDLMYVAIAAGVGLIGSAVGDKNLQQTIQDLTTGGFWSLFGHIMAPAGNYTQGAATTGAVAGLGLVGFLTGGPIGALIGAGISMLVSGIVGFVATPDATLGAAGMSFLSPIFFLIILLVLFFSVSRIFFILLRCYIQIIISIAFSPLLLIFNAVPGQNTFTNWWKGIMSNASAFVVVAIGIYFSWAISYVLREPKAAFWVPPLIAQGMGISQLVAGLISIGISLTIPDLVKKVQDVFKVKPALSLGPSALLGPVQSGVSGIFSQVSTLNALQNLSQSDSGLGKILNKVPGLNKILGKK